MTQKIRYTEPLICGHCGNHAPARILAEIATVAETEIEQEWYAFDYELLRCLSCGRVILRETVTFSKLEGAPQSIRILYPCPCSLEVPGDLPKNVSDAYWAARETERANVHAYAAMVRRVLESVCKDRKAKGDRLVDQLADLADKGEIPVNLVNIAEYLRHFGNFGAHAAYRKLNPGHIPLLRDLMNMILQYVYAAPFLDKRAKEALDQLKAE